ncbi:glycoside hydrolase family 3 N-terminal domain-containing protein [Mucilaginibacter jinjuensis]|uniref:beta-glucosidase n=1 Tax=Mucilaginibacter jinjuensis TaxID=1176721 RepID=A0ABY7TDS9_9SPHI|nr:glycoside hydrolase family 3 N-terminal domain-containing protein [Mucilaginibacter jinjuensis]WCT14181.1 glycoside hydrolase family 3 N-terminal domain-containing protein [Mucilaginibacter jinjuensis]
MKYFSLVTMLILGGQVLAAKPPVPVYKDKNAPVESRVEDLLKRMTLEEKIEQLNQQTVGDNNNPNNNGYKKPTFPAGIGSLIYFSADPAFRNTVQKRAMEETRLGIPILFGYDVIHGFRTIYPISLAQGCSWNPELVEEACAVAAKETKLSGIDWTFSPMIDVARDPRWGRVSEGYGEDPYTNAMFGVASVKGYQGKKLNEQYSIAACLKHYIGYGMSEGGRDYHYADISAQSLWETYMVPYEAGVKAGAATLMSGFNDISGIPASANPYTLTEVLKGRWKHDGFVVSDWGSVEQLMAQGVAKDRKEAGLKAFMAGVEMDMVDDIYGQNLKQLIDEKKVPMTKIDDAVKRILRIKFRLGLFDNPYTPIVAERYLQPESKAVAAKLATESMVLLKNKSKVLPLGSNIKSIALVGPLAKDQADLIGNWSAQGDPKDAETIIDGFNKEFAQKAQINYAKGTEIDGTDESGIAEAVAAAQKSDVVVVCLGEKKTWSGENTSRSNISLPAIQEKLVAELKKTGKPIVLVLANGRPLELVRLEPMADAIVEMWQPGVAGGTALASIISGRVNPSGKLDITFPLTTGQIPTYYDMRQSARPNSGKYQDIPTDPLYWFGHGLSYTDFTYAPISLSAAQIHKNQKLVATVEVSNTGGVTGKETALWYIASHASSISRPMKELKHFEKKEIAAGGKYVYKFEIDPMRDLSFPDADGKKHLESGDFVIMAGNQKIKFELVD